LKAQGSNNWLLGTVLLEELLARSAGQDFPHLLGNPKVHCLVHNSPPPAGIRRKLEDSFNKRKSLNPSVTSDWTASRTGFSTFKMFIVQTRFLPSGSLLQENIENIVSDLCTTQLENKVISNAFFI
jgi:hypothetical protein